MSTSAEIVRDLAAVEELGATTIAAFARREDVPNATARRRLNALANAGLIRRGRVGNTYVFVARQG